VGAGAISQQDPRRIAEAYNGLQRNLRGDAIKTILRLPVAERKSKATKSKATKSKKVKSSTESQTQLLL
jgi:CRISPR system Cascade subunit CasA